MGLAYLISAWTRVQITSAPHLPAGRYVSTRISWVEHDQHVSQFDKPTFERVCFIISFTPKSIRRFRISTIQLDLPLR